MKLSSHVGALKDERRPVFLAAGFFDGVHRGHQHIIRHGVQAARACRGHAWVMTFDPHPKKVITPQDAPNLLTATPHKLRLLEALGVDGCLVIPFTRLFAATAADRFVRTLVRAAPQLRRIVIGRDWTFGRDGQGSPELLRALGLQHGFEVEDIEPVLWRRRPISSTRIRRCVMEGQLDEASDMLGRPFSILGTVVPGQRLGREFGFPTANLDPHNEVFPPNGVYLATAMIAHRWRPGLINLGIRPTVPALGTPTRILELHLLDGRPNLYGRSIEARFLGRIRPEQRFPSLSALQQQIAADVNFARRYFAASGRLSDARFAPSFKQPGAAK